HDASCTDPPPPSSYHRSLHDALPISPCPHRHTCTVPGLLPTPVSTISSQRPSPFTSPPAIARTRPMVGVSHSRRKRPLRQPRSSTPFWGTYCSTVCCWLMAIRS